MLHRRPQLPIAVHPNKGAALLHGGINQRCLAVCMQSSLVTFSLIAVNIIIIIPVV